MTDTDNGSGAVTTATLRQASELAAAAAKVAHGGVQHGDNDPAATDHLKARVAAIDILVPRVDAPTAGYPMCWAWQGRAAS